MATLTEIPTQLMQGDSYAITLSPTAYPATDGWALSFAVAGATEQQWASAPSGDAHAFTLTTAQTAALTPGAYRWRLRATDGTATETFDNGVLEVLADIGAASAGSLQSYPERMLAICRLARESVLAGESRSFMIDGRQMMFHSLAELAKEEAHWRRELAAERRGSSFRKRPVTFVRG